MVKKLPDNAGDTGLILNLVRSHMPQINKAHALQLLNLCSRASERQLLRPHVLEPKHHNKRSHHNE